MPPDFKPDPDSLKDPVCGVCGTPLADRLGVQCPRCLLTFATTLGLAEEGGPPGDDLLDSLQVRRFGDYELLEEIARGGMGVVYRARQISLGREVAVKMILAGELATAESVQRFRNEASAAAQLHHPNIVSVFEIGEHETQHFFSMRLVRGRQNIATWSRGLTSSSADRARQIAGMLARVARAVAFAHERGVLHRDLKPSNILVDEQGEPQVTDFGLAKIVTEHDSALTLSAVMLGSPSYMAPEQADAHARDITTATDVYGLGAVLYELLAGRPPFHGATPFATVRMLLEEMPRPLPEAPRDLATVCLKCLAKEPAQRYPTAAAMADDLERFARGDPIRARPVTLPEAVWRWSRRRPKVAALFGVLTLVFVFGFAGVAWQWTRARQANAGLRASVAQLEWRRIVRLLESGDDTVGMAQLARFLRANPANPRAASLAISVLEQRGFATPAAPALSHGPETFVIQAQLSGDATRIVTAGSDGTARLWAAATSRPLGEPMRHSGPVRWVEFSADGRRIATGSDDRTARLWDAHSGAPLGPPIVHEGAVTMVKFAGEHLATISADGTARLWPAKGGPPLLLPLGAPGRALAVSADGSRLYAGSASGLQAWSADGRVLFTQTTGVDGLALSPDGARLASWSGKGLRIWDAVTGQEGASLEEMSGLGGAAWNPDGTRIAGAATAGWARIWDTTTGRPVTPRLEHLYRCTCVTFSPDGRTLLSGGADGAGRRWDAATGAATDAVLNHGEAVIGADYSASGTHLLVVGHAWNDRATPRGGEAQLWDLRRRGLQPWRHQTGGTAGAVAWSADGRFSASIIDGASLAVHEVARPTGQGDFTLANSLLGGWPRGLAFLPGERIAAVMNSGELGVWSLKTRERILGPVRGERIEVSRFFADGARVAIGETSGAVHIRDLTKGEILMQLPGHRAPVNGVAISPDGRFVATVGEDGRCLVSVAATGQTLWPAIQSEDEIVSVQFSPDGRWIITAGHDRTARIWDAQTGAPAGAPLWHGGELVYAEFSPDGTRVLSADRAGTVRIWNPRTGAPLNEPLTHPTALRGACFSPDGRRIATEDHTGLRLWEAATGEPLTLRQPHRTSLGIGFDTQGLHVLFSPDGRQVLQGTASSSVLLWSFPEPPVPSPAWLPDLLESLANLTVNERHAFVPIPQARWLSLREKLRALPGDDFYARWVRDYCGDPK